MMNNETLAIVVAIFGSTGLWTLINTLAIKKIERKSITIKMLLGLAHDRIYELCHQYIDRQSITADELENLIKYLYEPYKKLGGNGTGDILVQEVKKLPITK